MSRSGDLSFQRIKPSRIYIIEYSCIATLVESTSVGVLSFRQEHFSTCSGSNVLEYQSLDEIYDLLAEGAAERFRVNKSKLLITMMSPAYLTPEMLSMPNSDKWYQIGDTPVCRTCWTNYAEKDSDRFICSDCLSKI